MTKPIPNYRRFDFDAFIASLSDPGLDFFRTFQAFERECARVEASMSGRGGPQARADGGGQYVARLKRVMFWFHHGALADDGNEAVDGGLNPSFSDGPGREVPRLSRFRSTRPGRSC